MSGGFDFAARSAAAAASSGGQFVTNPKQLPLHIAIANQPSIKTAPSFVANASAAGFFTNMAFLGAQTSIAAADAFVTVCDLTGAGLFFNAVSPTHSAAFLPTMRITVDGVVYVIAPSASITASRRIVLGPVTTSASVAAASGDAIAPNAFNDAGFNAAREGGIMTSGATGGGFYIPTEVQILSYNMKALRFESSLKVEMKASLLSGGAVDKQCAVTYRLDI